MIAKLFVEFIATFIFLSVILSLAKFGHIAPLAVGITLAGLVFFAGDISGCHVNPAISFMSYLNGSMNTIETSGYILAQLAGAVAALWFSIIRIK